MTDIRESFPSEGAATAEQAPIDDLERDLDTMEAALAALDSGDVEEAESLAADLDHRLGKTRGSGHPAAPSGETDRVATPGEHLPGKGGGP